MPDANPAVSLAEANARLLLRFADIWRASAEGYVRIASAAASTIAGQAARAAGGGRAGDGASGGAGRCAGQRARGRNDIDPHSVSGLAGRLCEGLDRDHGPGAHPRVPSDDGDFPDDLPTRGARRAGRAGRQARNGRVR